MTDLNYYKELELVKSQIINSNMEDEYKLMLISNVEKLLDKIMYLADNLVFCPDCNWYKFQFHWKCEECKKPYDSNDDLKNARCFAKYMKSYGNKPEEKYR